MRNGCGLHGLYSLDAVVEVQSGRTQVSEVAAATGSDGLRRRGVRELRKLGRVGVGVGVRNAADVDAAVAVAVAADVAVAR